MPFIIRHSHLPIGPASRGFPLSRVGEALSRTYTEGWPPIKRRVALIGEIKALIRDVEKTIFERTAMLKPDAVMALPVEAGAFACVGKLHRGKTPVDCFLGPNLDAV